MLATGRIDVTNEIDIDLEVNDCHRTVSAPPWTTLAELLVTHLSLRGTRVGCAEGVCGSCTVLLDGQSVRACIVLAAQAQARRVDTVENVSRDPLMRELCLLYTSDAADDLLCVD